MFDSATLVVEGRNASLAKILENMDLCYYYLADQRVSSRTIMSIIIGSNYIQDLISKIKPRSLEKDLKLLLPGINSSFIKLETYFIKMQASPYYPLLLILVPKFRIKRIKLLWSEDRANKVIWSAKHFQEVYRDRTLRSYESQNTL